MKKLIKTLVVTSIFTFSFILSACGGNNQTQQENHTSCYFSNWETLRPATCHDEGEEIGYCECGNTQIRNVPMTNHNYHEYIEREPSCQEEGTIVTECSECGERHFKSIPVTEHAYVEVNHVEATCDQQGYTVFSCQQCGHEKHDNFVTGTQHIYSEFEVTEIPTYLNNGEAVRYCENNSSHVETVTLPSLDSNEYNSFMVGGGMCGQDQIYEYIYNYQGYQIRFEVVFPNEHDFEEFYHDATCEDPAVKGQICRNCGYIEEHIVAEPLQHYYGPWQISQLPTEYSSGEAIRTCYKDNNHIETLTLPALYSYEYNKQLIQEGSCISDAIYTYSYYDFISFEIVVEGEGHQLDYYSNLQPTCEEKGYESYEKCRLCDYTTYQEIPAKGHNLSPWETIFNATCETNGLKGRNCYECEYYEHEDIITSGHDLTYYDKLDSTCYSDGHEAYEQCSKCSYTTYQKIVAKQHYNEHASCKEYVVCDYCNDYFILPHKYENIKFDSYSHWKECECGQQAYYSSHNISDWYFTEVPSCDKEGIREQQCFDCDYKYSEVALISHDYVDNHCMHCNTLKPSENLYFELLDDGTLEVSIGSCMDSYVVIPQVYENMYVSKIADSGFYNCDFISQVYIANTITSIGKYAFANCDNLTEITVSSNTLVYNEQAFNGTNISKVNFDGEIEKWMEITFADHKATPLNNKADFYLHQTGELVENIEILNEVNVINDYAFYGFNSLKTISLPSSLTTIGASSFDKCDNLIFNEYDNAYYLGNATNNYMVLFKAKDSNIESCDVHENAFYIYKNAFLNCTNLKSFEIKENIKYVGKDILKGCSSLESLTVAFTGEDRDSNAELGYLFGKVSYSGSYLADTDYYIPNTLNTVTFNTTKVKSGELNGYTSLNEVILADSVKSIGSRAFANCGAIKLNIPSSIESIGIEFIQNTTMSKYYVYEDGLYIGNEQDNYIVLYQMHPDRNPYHFEVNENTKFIYSFSNSKSNIVLTEIVLHSNIKGILHDFSDTSTLQRVYYKGSMDDWSQITFNQSKNNPMSVATEFYVDENGYNEVTSINISSNITQIGNYAFYGFDNVTSITIPDSVTSLGYGVFGQCNKLEELTIPYIPTRNINYQTYYRLAFYFDVLDNSEITKTLTTLKIVNNQMDIIIQENSLSNLTNLTDLYIIGDVISVGNDAFYQDNKLTNVYYGNSIASWASIEFENINSTPMKTASHFYLIDENGVANEVVDLAIPEGIEYLSYYSFYGFDNLVSITLPSTLKESYNDFTYSNKVESVYFNGTASMWANIDFNRANTNPVITSKDKNLYFYNDEVKEYQLAKNVVIEEGVEVIKDYTFNYLSLESVTLPSTLLKIEDAFAETSSLVSVYYDGNESTWCNIEFTSLDSNPMNGAENFYMLSQNQEYQLITTFTIPEDVTLIKKYAFHGFDCLETLIINSSVEQTSENSFAKCVNLESVYYQGQLNDWLNVELFNSYEGTPMYYATNFYLFDQNNEYFLLTSLVIEEGISYIPSALFAGFDCLTSVTLPSSITQIGYSAFEHSTNISDVYYNGTMSEYLSVEFLTISANPTYYGSNLYIDGNKVIDAVIPNEISKIGVAQFAGSTIETILIGKGVVSIDYTAFKNCANLETIEFVADPNFGRNSTVTFAKEIVNGLESIKYTEYENGQYISSKDNPYFIFIDAIDKDVTSLALHKNTKIIAANTAITGCNNLTELALPNLDYLSYAIMTNYGQIEVLRLYDEKLIRQTELNNFTSLTRLIVDNVSEVNISTSSSYNKTLVYNLYENGCYIGSEENPYMVLVKTTSKDVTYVTIHEDTKLINPKAFEDCNNITSIVIPDGVTFIGDYLFNNSISIKEVTIPLNSLTSSDVFKNSSVEKVTITGEVIPVNMFSQLNTLKEVIITDSVIRIEDYAFASCKNLQSVTFASSLQEIMPFAFFGSGLKFADLSNTKLTYISDSCFYGSYIEQVILPESVTLIDGTAFYNCSELESINLENVTSIGKQAFSNTYSLTDVNILSVTEIGYGAFERGGLTSIAFSNKLTSIGDNAFCYCHDLAEIDFEENTNVEIPFQCFTYTSITTVDIPEGVVNIASYAFSDCELLVSVYLPSTIRNIADKAFMFTNVEKIYFKGTISDWAQQEGYNLMEMATEFYMLNDQGEWEEVTEIVIPENITSLNTSFASFEHLTKMTLHENVTSVERGFLAGNNALESLTLSTCLYEDLASYFTPYQSYGKSQVPSTLKELIIVGSITIPEGYFNGCSMIETLSLDKVISIESNAFANCSGIVSVDLGDNLETIGSSAFGNCSKLSSISIPSCVKTLQGNVFSGYMGMEVTFEGESVEIKNNTFLYTYIEKLYLPANVIIESNVLSFNAGVVNLYYNGTASMWQQYDITYTGYYPEYIYVLDENGQYVLY